MPNFRVALTKLVVFTILSAPLTYTMSKTLCLVRTPTENVDGSLEMSYSLIFVHSEDRALDMAALDADADFWASLARDHKDGTAVAALD